MAQIITSNGEKIKGREASKERGAQRAEHIDQRRELKQEQRELAKTIKSLGKELKSVLHTLDTLPSSIKDKITVKHDRADHTKTVTIVRDNSPLLSIDKLNTQRKELQETIQAMKDKRMDNSHELDLLRRLAWLESVGSDLRSFLAEPKNLGMIALILAMTPGSVIAADLLRRGQQAPELQMMLSGVLAGGLTAIGAELWLLMKRYKEIQEEVQEKIDYWRQRLSQWRSETV